MKLKQAGAIKEVFLPWVVGQYRSGEKEKWEVASVCRFHKFK